MARLDDREIPEFPNIYITGARTAYAPEDVRDTFTVGDLIDYFSQFDSESLVFIENDGGYTFGGITEDSIYAPEVEDDEYLDNLRQSLEMRESRNRRFNRKRRLR